jgi:SAM-dependent methyltransferase
VSALAALLGLASLSPLQDARTETRPASETLLPFEGRAGFTPMSKGTPPIPAKFVAKDGSPELLTSLPVAAVGAKEGETVADVGCGEGRHSFPLAQPVGARGRVYCRDVSEEAIEELRRLAKERGAEDLDTALSREDDVGLPPSSVDVALLCDVYHIVAFSQEKTRDAFLHSLFRSMKPGGVVVVCYVRANAIYGRERQVDFTIDDFARHGFVPGWRWDFVEEPNRPQVLEFQKPAS